MGKPSLNSPNDCWERHGYTVKRIGHKRQIFDRDGNMVIDGTRPESPNDLMGYAEEIQYCKNHNLMLKED
ncbi:MAG: hypothetical protein GY714_32400 [Desulfobacterales bacterium]|nr:hypothetical protein [Desulfobacterales bacterium]